MNEWVSEIGPYAVRRSEVSGGGSLISHPSACLHTTEGSTLDGAVRTIHLTGFAPHFTIGDNQIVQMRSLGLAGSALRAHNDHFIQVEAVGFSKLEVHQLTPATWLPLVALTRWMRDTLGIPMVRPPSWPDKLGSFPASDNERRRDGFSLLDRGVYGHVDVPDQSPTWHWDPGSLDYSALFLDVGGDDDMMFEKWREGYDAFFRKLVETGVDPGPPKDEWPEWHKKGWVDARRAANNPKGA